MFKAWINGWDENDMTHIPRIARDTIDHLDFQSAI
jgi:hypothetical protein